MAEDTIPQKIATAATAVFGVTYAVTVLGLEVANSVRRRIVSSVIRRR